MGGGCSRPRPGRFTPGTHCTGGERIHVFWKSEDNVLVKIEEIGNDSI